MSTDEANETGPDRLPAPIAWRAAELMEGLRVGNPWLEGVYFAESVFRFAALLIKASYLEQDQPDPFMNRLIHLNLTWPSMGAWRQFVERVHRRTDSGAWKPDLPGFEPLFRAIGESEKLVTLRNAALGHPGSRLDEEAAALTWKQMSGPVERLLTVVHEVLPSCRLLVQDETGKDWLDWTGPVDEGRWVRHVEAEATAPALLEVAGRPPLPLFPLVLRSSSEFVEKTPGAIRNRLVLFDGADHRRKHLILVGRHGQARTKSWFAHWRARMHLLRVPTVPLGDEALTPELVLGRISSALEAALADIEDGFEPVELDQRAVGSLDAALASEAGFAVLGGMAGAGKSTILAHVARRWSQAGIPILFVQARDLASERFADRFRGLVEGAIGIPAKPDVLLEYAAASAGTRAAVLVDGLDEVGAPQQIRRLIDDVQRWAKPLTALVVMTCRSDVWRDLQRIDREERGKTFERLAPVVFRFSGKGSSGADEDSALIPLPPLDDARARTCWETYRRQHAAVDSGVAWDALPDWARSWCRNPRRLMRLLEHLRGETPVANDRWSVWRTWLDREAGSGMGRAAMRRLVAAQIQSGSTEVRLADLFPGPWGAVSSTEYSAANHLVSSGVWRLRVDPTDPEESLLVSFAAPELAVVAWQTTEPFRRNSGESARQLLEEIGTGSAAQLVRDVCARHLAEAEDDLGSWSWVDDSILGAAWCDAARTDVLLELRKPQGRSAILVAACQIAFDEGRVHELADRADTILHAAPPWLDGPAVEWLARVLRHRDRPSLDVRLCSLIDRNGPVAASALLALAELRRESGQWRPALNAYDQALRHPDLTNEQRLIALSAAGESHLWLLEEDQAIARFEDAFALLTPAASAFVRCNLYIKRSIVWRRKYRPVLAARDLRQAEDIAVTHHLRVERAKIDLEKGLTLFLFGSSEDALHMVNAALSAHRQLHFIKGIKKALYCKGLILLQGQRPAEAEAALVESLKLNERFFDRLGLALVHMALAKVQPHRIAHHIEQAKRYARKLGGIPHATLL